MNDQKGCGCMVAVFIVIVLVGVWLRSHGLKEFLVIGGLLLLGVIFLVWAIADPDIGFLAGLFSLLIFVSVGYFLVTGNYNRSIEIVKFKWKTSATDSSVKPETTSESGKPSATLPYSDHWSWLFKKDLPQDQVSKALNKLWTMSSRETEQAIQWFNSNRNKVSDQGRHAIGLLISVTFEHTGALNKARAAYEDVIDKSAGLPYAASANLRLRILDDPESSDDMETIYEIISGTGGWLLLSGQWIWNTRHDAMKALTDIRADQLSFRFFQFLWSRSLFPKPYAYLFILLVMTIGIKLLEMPLSIKTAKLNVQLRHVNPMIQEIRSKYSDDPLRIQEELSILFRNHNIDLKSGCSVFIVDLIFLIWALIALSSFSPQFVLDKAELFFWIPDVTQWNSGIILAWALLSMFQFFFINKPQMQTGRTNIPPGQFIFGLLFQFSIISGIAWYWKWPAYVFIFWILLTFFGIVINSIMKLIITN